MPVGAWTRFVVTSSDVIHAWSVPALAIKIDAIPGRLNVVTSFVARPGVYWGQCSELCRANHTFMPIVVAALP